ncbi:hypothetical protein ABK040_006463 [Willaertia magna]
MSDESKRKRGDSGQEETTEEPTTKKSLLVKESEETKIDYELLTTEEKRNMTVREGKKQFQQLEDAQSRLNNSFQQTLNPIQYKRWSKEQVCCLLCSDEEKGGADLSPKEIVVSWVDNLLKTRLYHLWSTTHAKQQLCEPTVRGGAGLEQKEFEELESRINNSTISIVLNEIARQNGTDKLSKAIKDWLKSMQFVLPIFKKVPQLEDILDSLVLTEQETVKHYNYCATSLPFVPRASAFKDYCKYVDDTLAGRDLKESQLASIVFIGDCPGVGKSRFAKELPSALQQHYSTSEKLQKHSIIDLAIWFSNGYTPTKEEAKDFKRLTISRIIYSYITYVRPHQWPNKTIIPLQKQIFDDLEGVDLCYPSSVFKWIAKKEFSLRNTPIWIHFTIDEYNQLLRHFNGEELVEWCEYLSLINRGITDATTFFTVLLVGTHREAFLNLQSKDSGGPIYIQRINVTNFNQRECDLLYKLLQFPETNEMRCKFASFSGHARLISLFYHKYKEKNDKLSISEILVLVENEIGSNKHIQLEDDAELAEFLLMLCFTGVQVSRNLTFKEKVLSKYQRSNIIFLNTTNDNDIRVEIPLIVACQMIKQVHNHYRNKEHFFSKLSYNLETWLSYGENFVNFEQFNQNLLCVKLCSLQKLHNMEVISESISLSFLFADETLKYKISLNNVNFSLDKLDFWYPTSYDAKKHKPIEMNVIYKNKDYCSINGKGAPFADLFLVLPTNDDSENSKLYYYLQVKLSQTNLLLEQTEIEQELNKLDKNKEKVIQEWGPNIYVLFLPNQRTGVVKDKGITTKFSVIGDANATQYYGPFSYLITTLLNQSICLQ